MTKSTTRVAADLQTFTQTEITAKDVVAKAGRKNLIINGGFGVWQRGVTGSQANQAAYISADRWLTYIDINSTVSLSKVSFALGQTDVEGNPESYAKFDWLGTGSTALKVIEQRVENVIPVSGAPITLSFYARTEQADDVEIRFTQDNGVGGSAQVGITGGTVDCTTSWKKFTKTITLPSLAGKTVNAGSYLKVGFWSQGTLNSHLELANVQLELGSVATDFEHRSYGEELALCQRYFTVLVNEINRGFCGSAVWASGTSYGYVSFPTEMRITPSIIFGDVTGFRIFAGGNAPYVTNVAFTNETSRHRAEFLFSHSGLTVGQAGFIRVTSATHVYADAEIY
jgi:hypothetical protein